MVKIFAIYTLYILYITIVASRNVELVHEKPNNLGSDQVQHKPGCTVTEAG